MERKSIGNFIAVLRKSKGMTQQDVAEQLNVSNKTVSKWECGDGYPEIMMVPAIAELFGVTADEILKGERIINNSDGDAKSPGTGRHVKFLLKKMTVKFKNLSFMAAAFILLGLISLFSISYSFYKPVTGFGVMMVLVLAGIITELIAINNIHSSYEASEMLKEKNDISMNYLKLVYRYSSFVFSTAVFVITAGLPFIFVQSDFYRDSVISLGKYITILPSLILAAAFICSIGRYAGRKKIGRAYFPLISKERIKKIASLNRIFIIIISVVFLLTVVMNIFAARNISELSKRRFASKEDFEYFISEKEQYEKEKQAAIDREDILVNSPSMDTRDQNTIVREKTSSAVAAEREIFYLAPKFENVEKVDFEEMTVYAKIDAEMLRRMKSTLNMRYRRLYVIEIYMVGIIYLILKRKIITDG